MKKIILASGSPRRRQLMELAGIPCEIIVSNADETISGPPDIQARELALRKANAVLPLVSDGSVVIAADTLVYIDGRVLGKPESPEEAFSMLKTLEGRRHTVFTGVAICKSDAVTSFVEAADVFFRPLSDEEIRSYIATGEPFDKAGAYGVQERGAVLVDRVEGDFYTVVGLPISKVCRALSEMGYDIWQ